MDKLSIGNNEDLFNLKKGLLSEAIIEYFSLSFQTISVELTFEHCKIIKHFVDDTGTESLDRMLHKNSNLLMDLAQRKEEYRVLPYLLSIPEETRERLLKGFIDKNLSMQKARMLTRLQTQPIFNLSERDIIFFLRERIWVRYYTPPGKVPEGRDKRYAGESQEELMSIYQSYFPNGMWEDIESVIAEVLEEKLNFSFIDNATFNKTFIPVFRGMIEVLLIDSLSVEERGKIEGFTGFILRKYFDRILLYTAKNLLGFVENRDKNAETFIKYFSEDVIIDQNGNKVQKYAIVDFKQQKWNYISIYSILLQYKQAKLRMHSQKELVATAREQVHQTEEEIKGELNNKKEQEDTLSEINSLIAENEMIAIKNRNESDASTIASHSKSHEDLFKRKKSESNLLDLVNNRISNKTIELTRRRKKLAQEIKTEQAIMEQIAPLQESYDGIAHGLAVVLTKR